MVPAPVSVVVCSVSVCLSSTVEISVTDEKIRYSILWLCVEMRRPMRIAVIGGGVSASTLTFGLRDVLASKLATVHIFEMGRVAGGRATTRSSRDMPGLRIDHGVPAFSAQKSIFRELCDQMLGVGALRRCNDACHGTHPFGLLKVDGRFEAEDKDYSAPTRFCAPIG